MRRAGFAILTAAGVLTGCALGSASPPVVVSVEPPAPTAAMTTELQPAEFAPAEPAPVEMLATEAPLPEPTLPETAPVETVPSTTASVSSEEPPAPPPASDDRWRISLMSWRTAEKAAQWHRRIEDRGYSVETEAVTVAGETWYRLSVPGDPNLVKTQAMIPKLEQEFGVSTAWVPQKHSASITAVPAPAPEPEVEPAPTPPPVTDTPPPTLAETPPLPPPPSRRSARCEALLRGTAVCTHTLPPAPDTAPTQALVRVAALQAPVWLERAGRKTAVRAGDALQAQDTLLTGAGGRVHLSLDDASTVKLGESAALAIPQLQNDKNAAGDVLRGALHVLKGAFRYTTSALGAARQRDLRLQIGNGVTAGIRGTDVWGKAETSQELICLLEGKIEVSSPGHEAVTLDQPLTFYVVPQGEAPRPVAPVPVEKVLQVWAPQTELVPKVPVLSTEGTWAVTVLSTPDPAAADRAMEHLSQEGYGVEAQTFEQDGAPWQRLVLKGLQSENDAQQLLSVLERLLGAEGLSVQEPAEQ